MTSLPVRLSTAGKAITVFFCPECGSRFLGIGYCEACDSCCRGSARVYRARAAANPWPSGTWRRG
jgi:hypothetical protein